MLACENRVAIVTGAAGQGCGRSIALTLAREGAKVVVNYRTSEKQAHEIVEHIRARGGQAIAAQANVLEAGGCRQLFDATVAAFGQADICIIGPGAGWNPEPPDKLNAAASLTDLQQEVAPIYHLMPLALPGMYERKWGRWVAISMDRFDSPSYGYHVGKSAREQALLLAKDSAWKHGVTMNIVGPGEIEYIPILAEAIEQCDHGPAWQNRKRFSPQDVAEGVTFLCSDAGTYISGSKLRYSTR